MNLKRLAEILNLSQTTVSRALNGYSDVSEATRARVQQAAEQYDYRPSMRAKSLATGRAMAIGHVIPVTSGHEMVNPVFGDFIAGAGETYSARGYDTLLKLVPDGDEERVYRDLKSRGTVDGIIVHGPRMNDQRIALLHEIGLPFVVHGRASDIEGGYSWLDVNNKSAFQRATKFLLDLGHSRIALINGLEEMDFAHRRRNGYVQALKDRHIDPDPALMRSEEMTEIYGYRSAREMLSLPAAPTAFLTSSMISAIGVRRALEDAGLKMGRDVSVITHDDDLSYLKNGEGVPIFTATRSSVRDAGRECAKMLLDYIQDPSMEPVTRLLEVDLTVGYSTEPVSRHALVQG
ncbi:LacI family DNA-binding transcriptional regulator [Sulfitobacter sp. MF3-043]|uniref:LacI family DNA-binding transcriptional regulator n=1 Tax=Sulfitobacter sediminivivens TaxID=3252902 RepID=UPI0036DAFEC9